MGDLKHPFPNGWNWDAQLLKMRLGVIGTAGYVSRAAQFGGWCVPPVQPGQYLFGPSGLACSVVLLQRKPDHQHLGCARDSSPSRQCSMQSGASGAQHLSVGLCLTH